MKDQLPSILVFDVDGTLVDVRRSYRAAAPLAAARYLALLGLVAPPLTGDAYDRFKLMGGFNDDWDLTAGLLEALLAPLPPAPRLPPGVESDPDAMIAALRRSAAPLSGLTPPLPDFAALVPAVRSQGGGLAGLRRITGGVNAHLVWRTRDAATDDLVQRLFSELYLGGALFAEGYGYPPRFHHGPGLIETEQLIVRPETLSALSQRAQLAIATGRTDFELVHPLRRLGLGLFFAVAATASDAFAAQQPRGPSLLKPHPYLLERAADALDPSRRLAAAYIGDSPDDIAAARNADPTRRWTAVAIVPDPANDDLYRSLGADLILRHPDELTSRFTSAQGDRR